MSETEARNLTPREAEVLELIAHGLTNAQVGQELDVTVHAVKFHLASIYRKLGVTNRTEAAGLFFQQLGPAREGAASARNGERSEREQRRRQQAVAAPPLLDLALAPQVGGRARGRGRAEACFGSELTSAVRVRAADDRVDVGTLVLAGFGTLLHRYTGVQEMVLRGAAGPLWIDVTGDPSFGELVGRVRRELDAGPAGSDGDSATPMPALQIAFAAGAVEPRCDLEVTVEERVDGLVAVAAFNLEACDGEAVEQLLRRLPVLLADAVDDPGRSVGALALISPAERVRMLEEWNDTASPYPDCRADALFATQAQARPEEVAVEFEGARLTYRELDGRANGLARLLQELGVGPDVLVAIFVERSLDMLVGLLGIMRAGGAYVPIDPAFPADRRRFMLEDAGVRVVVTQESLLPEVDLADAHTICLDRDAARIGGAGATAPPCEATADSLAYVIYTSGSTGKPKGVQIPHRALVNFLTTMSNEPGMAPDDVLVAVTTLSFDIAGLELYLPLATGARVVVAPQATTADPRRLAQLIEHVGATVVQATPTTWRMLLDSGWPGIRGLKALCGGEALPAVLAEQLLEHGLELWNMYGPTETTIWSSVSRVRPGQPLTIGRPIANTTFYVLDDRMQPVPVGLPGELHIGGEGLARGYLNRPELTAERFVPHPFDPGPEARLYKTGDLVRYRDDGTIDFLGRRDHQVKVRGFRIELGEIETALARQSEVGAAVAVVREDTPGDVRIVGYVAPLDGTRPVAGELRHALVEILPAYMVPSSVVVLDELPLTPNGKIDRKALPTPTVERAAEGSAVAPRTQLEEQLVAIWERELQISPIGVTDDFFDLGVTSIVAARLFARLERELARDLPLGAIYQAPTIERLALLLETGSLEAPGRWTSLVPMQPRGSKTPIFCVHGGAGTILHLQPLARRLGTDRPFYGLQSRGLYGRTPPHRTVEEMSEHYLQELRTVQEHGPYLLAGYCFGSIVAFDMAQRLTAEGEEVALLAVFNGPSPVWLHKYGAIGGQPSRRARPVATVPQPVARRVLGVLASPAKQRQWAHHFLWRFRKQYIWPLRVRISLRRGRALPEHIREDYFLRIHARAELAYEPVPYAGKMTVFYGANLYDDPTLGWEGLASSVETVAVAGDHANNRTMMAEPYVEHVHERLEALLADLTHSSSPNAA